MSGPFDPDIWS